MELEISRSSQHKVNEGWGGWGVLDRLIIIECVLQGLSFIPQVEHHDCILTKSLFKELSTSAYKVASSAYEIILFSMSFTNQLRFEVLKLHISEIWQWSDTRVSEHKIISYLWQAIIVESSNIIINNSTFIWFIIRARINFYVHGR